MRKLKIKLDENIGYSIYSYLLQKKIDVETVLSEGLKGSKDEAIYMSVRREKRILITLDKGFGNFINYPLGKGFGIVILRPDKNFNIKDIKEIINKFLKALDKNSPYGKLWVVSRKKVREYNPAL